jgi:hypothetical protein
VSCGLIHLGGREVVPAREWSIPNHSGELSAVHVTADNGQSLRTLALPALPTQAYFRRLICPGALHCNSRGVLAFMEGGKRSRWTMQIRQWWIRHFTAGFGADMESGDFERCSCCGQIYYNRDLQQVLPHFEHQLGLSAVLVKGPLFDGHLWAPFGNVMSFRRARKPTAGEAWTARRDAFAATESQNG